MVWFALNPYARTKRVSNQTPQTLDLIPFTVSNKPAA